MAGDGSGTGPSEPPKEASSSVIIRAIPLSFRDEKEKEAFWQAYAAYVDQVTPKPSIAGTPATTQPKTAFDYESLIKDKFPVALKEGFKSFLSVPYGAETRTRQRALIALRFSVKEISYGPIGIETTIENLDKIIDASLTLDAAIAILSTSAPGALNAALGSSYPMWAIAISDVNLRRPPPSKGEPETSGWRWFFARFPNPVTILTLLILLWIVPIAVTLFVLMSTYLEMNRRISSYDKDLLKVQTDEIARPERDLTSNTYYYCSTRNDTRYYCSARKMS